MKLIFIVKILHFTSLWKRDHRQFGNGLLMNLYSKKTTKPRHWTYRWMDWIWFLQITWYDCPHHPFQGGREYIGQPSTDHWPKSHIASKLNENEKTYISVTDLEIENSLPQCVIFSIHPLLPHWPLYTWVVKLYKSCTHSLKGHLNFGWNYSFRWNRFWCIIIIESFKILKVHK